MEVTVLGKYGPFAPKNSATSGYLLQTERANVLIDCGSGIVSKLVDKNLVKDLSFIVLSHLHFDHVSDMGVLSYALSFSGRKDKINVYLPYEDCAVYNMLKSVAIFNLIPIEAGVEYKEASVSFSFYETVHPVKSYGVKFASGNKVFAYTGDTVMIDNLKNLVKGANLVVADGNVIETDYKPTLPHMSVKQACSLTNYFEGKLLISHISYKYDDKTIEKEISLYTERAEVAKENVKYNV